MREFRPIFSEDPRDLEVASEWAKEEIEKMKREEAASDRIMERIRPLLEKMSNQRKNSNVAIPFGKATPR